MYEKTRRKTSPFVHHRSHRTTLGLNLGLYGEKLVTEASATALILETY
jgi:hypothetical protein